MKQIRYLGFAAALLMACIAFWPHYYVCSVLDSDVTVLSNPKEAYVYFGESTTGESISAVGIIWKKLTSIYPEVYSVREDLILVHIGGPGGVQKSEKRDFGFRGSLCPINSSIYYLRGARKNDGPRMWRWDRTNFVSLNGEETSKIRSSFQLTSNILQAEGWDEKRIRFDGSEVVFSFPLGSGKCVLSLEQQPINGNVSQTIKVHGEGILIPEQILADQDGKSRVVSRSDYLSQIPQD